MRSAIRIQPGVDRYTLTPVGRVAERYEELVALITTEAHVLYIEVGEVDELHPTDVTLSPELQLLSVNAITIDTSFVTE